MVLVLDGKTDLNQISLTGLRALTLIGLLAEAPHSLEEIREKFLENKIMDKSQSDDILRIDMNTIKSFGCEISRIKTDNGYKYFLTKHPFDISITKDDVKVFKKLYDKIKNSISISKLFEIDKFLNKVAEHIYDTEVREALLGISFLKHYDRDMARELDAACVNGYTLRLNYKKTYAAVTSEKEIIAQKLVYVNNKLYLYGYDTEKKDFSTLLLNRIQSVISKRITCEGCEKNKFKVKFLLKNSYGDLLTKEEKILETQDGGYLTEGNYYNEFLAMQRVLSFGSKCTVIEPKEFRNKIVSKLKEMRKLYEK